MTETVNLWSQLSYRDPEITLRELRELELLTDGWDVSDNVRRLRTGDLKNVREGRNAALFSHGMATVVGAKVYFAAHEDSDYDFITRWLDGDIHRFCPVQLKELPPADRNSTLTLETLLTGLNKYQPTQTALAVLLNKPAHMPAASIPEAARRFSQAWFFWQASEDGSLWKLQGDVLRTFHTYDFHYPIDSGAA